jgi:hypothetical protein
MISRRAVICRLILAPVGAGLSLLAIVSLAGCGGENSDQLKPQQGNRDDPKSQRNVEIPPGIPSSVEKPNATTKGR